MVCENKLKTFMNLNHENDLIIEESQEISVSNNSIFLKERSSVGSNKDFSKDMLLNS